ncbi:MAG TPA: AMP-binding protein [Longimicrobiaceae bacterium]|nr:AMP-binding protein [Longimicrobiaceae bacterium]
MELSLPQLLTDTARRRPQRTAVLQDDSAVSFAGLAHDVDRLAGRLAERGVRGRVGVLLPNIGSFPLVLYGILRAGGSALLLNPMNSPREVEEQLRDAGVESVFTTEPLTALLPRGARALLAGGLPDELRVVSEVEDRLVRLAGAPAPPPMPPGGDHEAVTLYTAAERGRARGAVLSHTNLVADLEASIEAMGIAAEDRVLGVLPYVHTFGLTVGLTAPLAAGATVIPVERYNPLKVLDVLEDLRPTVMLGVPTIFIGLISAVERRGTPKHSLRVAISGGAPLAPEVAARWEEVFGLPLRQGYGLTEASPVCLFNRVDRPNHRGAVGSALPGVEVTVRAPDGEELPAGEVGEICVRGPNVFGGYLGEGGRQPDEFWGDWLRTGDLGSIDAEGVVRFRGVLKPMFTRNGFNVYPHEIERVLEADERIEHAEVLARPEPVRENEIVLRVVRASGAPLTDDEVREICRARLAAYKQPTRIRIG